MAVPPSMDVAVQKELKSTSSTSLVGTAVLMLHSLLCPISSTRFYLLTLSTTFAKLVKIRRHGNLRPPCCVRSTLGLPFPVTSQARDPPYHRKSKQMHDIVCGT